MPRRASAKKTTRTAKAKSPIANIDKLEKDFSANYTTLQKEVAKASKDAQKVFETLKKELKRATKAKTVAKNKRVKARTKAAKQDNAANRKAVKTTTADYNKAAASVDTIKDQLETAREASKVIKLREKKIASLSKALDKFEKAWAKQEAKALKPAKRKKRKTAGRKKAIVVVTKPAATAKAA